MSDFQLLDILEHKEDYQPLAIEAAIAELERRQLTEGQLEAAKTIMAEEQLRKENAPIRVLETRMKATGLKVFETVNPILKDLPTAERLIRFMIIVLGLLFIYNFIRGFGNYLAAIRDFGSYPLIHLEYLGLPLILAIGLFLFWQRKTWGWSLLVFYVSYSVCGSLVSMYFSLTWKSPEIDGSGFIFDFIYSPPPVTSLLPVLLFWSACMYVLCRKDVREIFKIDKEKMTTTFVITGLLMVFVTYLISR